MTRLLVYITLALTTLSGCRVSYSFTGIDIGEAKTFTVDFFPNYTAQLAPPTYSQQFTESLRDILLQQTNLQMTDRGGDLYFTGEIKNYRTSPIGIGSNDQSTSNRLTVSVKVNFKNAVNPDQNFERTFSKYVDYDAGQNLSTIEDQLTAELNDQLTQSILQAALGNW